MNAWVDQWWPLITGVYSGVVTAIAIVIYIRYRFMKKTMEDFVVCLKEGRDAPTS